MTKKPKEMVSLQRIEEVINNPKFAEKIHEHLNQCGVATLVLDSKGLVRVYSGMDR